MHCHGCPAYREDWLLTACMGIPAYPIPNPPRAARGAQLLYESTVRGTFRTARKTLLSALGPEATGRGPRSSPFFASRCTGGSRIGGPALGLLAVELLWHTQYNPTRDSSAPTASPAARIERRVFYKALSHPVVSHRAVPERLTPNRAGYSTLGTYHYPGIRLTSRRLMGSSTKTVRPELGLKALCLEHSLLLPEASHHIWCDSSDRPSKDPKARARPAAKAQRLSLSPPTLRPTARLDARSSTSASKLARTAARSMHLALAHIIVVYEGCCLSAPANQRIEVSQGFQDCLQPPPRGGSNT